jgi:PAS domain S-box-containing protein
MTMSAVLPGFYDYRLVALSVSISVLAAYAALDLAERVSTARGGIRMVWLYGGAMAMGIGIWAMHYIGMVAYHVPVQVLYDWPTVLLSLFTAIAASGAALFVVSRPTMSLLRTTAGSIIMGAGIAGMHYIGMEAMRLPAMCVYSPELVSLSVVLAVAISFVALQLAFARREDHGRWGWRKLASGLVMGLAIPVMHYVGMAAVTFMPDPSRFGGLEHAFQITPFGLAVISIATIVILGHVCIASVIDRRLWQQRLLLAESRLQLQSTFDNMTEGVIVLDREMNIVQINREAARLHGMAPGTTSFDTVRLTIDAFSPDGELLPLEQRPIARAFRGDFVRDYELGIGPKGTPPQAIVAISTAPIADETGTINQIIVSYREITERKRVDASHSRLAAIVESSEDGIIGKDLNGIVTSWNRGAERIFGYTPAEMIGQSILRLLPAGREHEEDEILSRIRRGLNVEHIETERKKKDGQIIHVSLAISPIRDASNKIIGASKVARDISERKQLERQLRQSQKMEAIGQLTGGIAHDFNNLLGVIVGNLDLLERAVADNQASTKRVQTAQRAAARGADLTRRLLAFSSKEELNPSIVLLEESIQNTIALADRALGPEIAITTHFDASVPSVFVDAAGLESALLNLAVNARDAMPKGGTLTISTELSNLDASYPPVHTGELKEGRYACISVTDTGEGMSRETLERAFEPFFTTKPRGKGTGLGLAMVYGFVKQSGGTVRLYSEVGIGTTVSLYLPLAGKLPEPVPAIVPVQTALKQGGTVLVVDDEADLLEIALAYLQELGYTALQATDGVSALEIAARSGDIDLLVTDVIMPGGMNGVELARKVQQMSPKTKVIFSSGFPADALEERSGKLFGGHLLRKPYQRAEFIAAIRNTMEATGVPSKGGDTRYAETGV